jgi:tetraacyldisaccharide 4'-kinase
VSVKRPWLLPLVPLYRVGVGIKNFLYDCGWLRVRRLKRPVISVGSLSAGGAGKTPVVMMLAELLGRHGIGVDVLTRGYGRGSGVVEEVDAAGSALRFGDEPLEMAKAGLRVFVGAERFEAGTLAESVGDARVHLLDDGFQHRRLGRSFDVLLLTTQDVDDWLLPAGNLREPLASVRKADVVAVREDEFARLATAVSGCNVWLIRRRLDLPVERPKRPVAFCGIARPEGFAAMLKDADVEVAGTVVFPDHHAYSEEDFGRLMEAARHMGADGFVTTAKDAVKISAEAMARLKAVGIVWVTKLRVCLVDEDVAMTRLRGVFKK